MTEQARIKQEKKKQEMDQCTLMQNLVMWFLTHNLNFCVGSLFLNIRIQRKNFPVVEYVSVFDIVIAFLNFFLN